MKAPPPTLYFQKQMEEREGVWLLMVAGVRCGLHSRSTLLRSLPVLVMRMDAASILGVIGFGIIVSLQLLSVSISTGRPIITAHRYLQKEGVHINNHSSGFDNSHGSSKHKKGHPVSPHITNDDYHTALLPKPAAPLVPALFAFGDSTVDAGNNNHLTTLSRSNFAPYGRDLPEKQPTGRFCNGKLVTDYIAAKLGLEPRMIAYLDLQSNVKARLGVLNMPLHLEISFASASSGFYDSTATHFNALSLKKQVSHFIEYRHRLFQELGEEDALKVLEKAIFIISTGTNDYLNNYFVNVYLKTRYSLSEFHNLILEICSQLIKDLYDLGARRVGVVSLPPFGCLPAIRTIYRELGHRGCIGSLNAYASNFNQRLQMNVLPILQGNLSGMQLAYMDSNTVLLDIVQNPDKYGIKETQKSCCGSGRLEVGIFCNKLSIGTCKDARLYAFWDSFHPTEQTNEIIATKLLEQVWDVFGMDVPYVYHYKDPFPKMNIHKKENGDFFLQMEQWRLTMVLLGGVFYMAHLVTQFFPKIIDLRI